MLGFELGVLLCVIVGYEGYIYMLSMSHQEIDVFRTYKS